LIYGVNGYTGGLVAREAARPGVLPTLAGRNLIGGVGFGWRTRAEASRLQPG
jgi:hypothetical protein